MRRQKRSEHCSISFTIVYDHKNDVSCKNSVAKCDSPLIYFTFELYKISNLQIYTMCTSATGNLSRINNIGLGIKAKDC